MCFGRLMPASCFVGDEALAGLSGWDADVRRDIFAGNYYIIVC